MRLHFTLKPLVNCKYSIIANTYYLTRKMPNRLEKICPSYSKSRFILISWGLWKITFVAYPINVMLKL